MNFVRINMDFSLNREFSKLALSRCPYILYTWGGSEMAQIETDRFGSDRIICLHTPAVDYALINLIKEIITLCELVNFLLLFSFAYFIILRFPYNEFGNL